jgi:SAM-dependent methyltransferase
MDVRALNREAWNRLVDVGDRWTIPVNAEEIARARLGDWSILLTPTRPVPRSWFPADLSGVSILCLASGGGQQGPILAATGATVTVFDNSPKQLGQDRMVAEREGLDIRTIEGDMADLSVFDDETFDLIFHSCSNCFISDVRPVWREAYRVLRKGGVLSVGFVNPIRYVFDEQLEEQGQLVVRHGLPYSDLTSLDDSEREQVLKRGPLQFGHTLEDQIGGQLDAGFVISGMYEDRFPEEDKDLASRFFATCIATRAAKPQF